MTGERKEVAPLILLVEDREEDIIIIQRAFERTKIPAAIQPVRDGEEAIAYLQGMGPYSNRTDYPLPWLVLLDLKMPGMTGFDVLRWIRSQPGLRRLVVVVLTSSDQIRDVNEAYALGANSFMVKPLDFDNTSALAQVIHQYWLQHSRLPVSERDAPRKLNGGVEL